MLGLLITSCQSNLTKHGGHKPGKHGILGDFSEYRKLMEFSGNSVQRRGKLTLLSGCK